LVGRAVFFKGIYMSYNSNVGYGRALMDAIHSVAPTFGRVFVVVSSSDAGEERYDRLAEVIKPYAGKVRLFTSISDAYDATTTNNHDVILLDGDSAHTPTSMLTITKNRVHFIGLAGRLGHQNSFGLGSRARITMGDSTVAADIALMHNTGVGNTFTGIKFDSSSTVAASLYGVAEGGEYTIYDNCEFYKSSDLNETAAAEVLNNGDSVQWVNCVFGSTSNIVADDKIRPNML
jgi:hypothetical protein